MAGTEGMSGPSTDESFSSKLQWLRQRREALQDKLAQKNNELKTLCIEEAELTGVLPPEIPLEPGESPPTFRKRVGTSYTYPQNMINKLKTNEAVSKNNNSLHIFFLFIRFFLFIYDLTLIFRRNPIWNWIVKYKLENKKLHWR